MRIEIRSQNLEIGEERRSYIERRLRFALGRFGAQVGRVTVSLAEVNGPRSSLEKFCRIVVHLVRSGQVLVEDASADLGDVVDRAADRAGQVVRRELERRREESGQLTTRSGPGSR